MEIDIVDTQDDLNIDENSVRKIVEATIKSERQRCDEVVVNFVTIERITKLHGQFFDDPTPTDCISLPLDDNDDGGYRLLGEIFVCPKVAQDYSVAHGTTVAEELTLYIVHSTLHLLGYDDIDDDDTPLMREAEERAMKTAKVLAAIKKILI